MFKALHIKVDEGAHYEYNEGHNCILLDAVNDKIGLTTTYKRVFKDASIIAVKLPAEITLAFNDSVIDVFRAQSVLS